MYRRNVANFSELKREQAWSRIYLVPAILAEQDRDAYRRQQASLAREKEIMKDVPDWKVRLQYQQADIRLASPSTTLSGIPRPLLSFFKECIA